MFVFISSGKPGAIGRGRRLALAFAGSEHRANHQLTGDADLQAAISLFEKQFQNPEAITDTETRSRATLQDCWCGCRADALVPGKESATAETPAAF